MKLANRIFFSVFGLLAFSTLASTITGALLISDAVRSEAGSRVELGLKEARSELEHELEALRLSAELLAQGLQEHLDQAAVPEIAALFPSALPSGLLEAGLDPSRSQSGTLCLGARDLAALAYRPDAVQTAAACTDGRLLCLFATWPGQGGTAFAATVLNGNIALVRRIQENLFGKDLYGSKPFGTVTVFCRDVRVATTVLGPGGELAIGTRVSDEVREKVLEQGEVWLKRAYVVDEWYLSAYEPLQSPDGDNIGILYVGVLERKYTDIRNRAVTFLSALIIPTLGLVMAAVLLMARGIVRPLSSLAEASAQISLGRFEPRIEVRRGAEEIRVLARAFQSMKEAIREREERLRLQNQELEIANKDYQELLSFVTHELNNSIGSLLLNVSLLAEDLEADAGPQGQTVDQIVRDVERFRDMVKNYLNLSRLEKGTLRFNPEPLDVRLRVIEPVLERLERWITHRKFAVHWDWPQAVVVQADAALLDIVFSNFIVNALKYGREWISFSARREGEDWLLAVANGGSPIPREKIPLLFRKFSRLVGSSDGAGLGLYLVQKIVERHGGEVWCESPAAPEPAGVSPTGCAAAPEPGAQPSGSSGARSGTRSGARFCLRLHSGSL